MTLATHKPAQIIRTERGLTISGTRISLYAVMDLLKGGRSHPEIRQHFHLSKEQLQAALEYLQAHSVEAEYQEVVEQCERIRQDWQARNQERVARIAAKQRTPEQAKLWQKLQAQKSIWNTASWPIWDRPQYSQ
ncbi:MAG: DUF433 domain-containing protein [Cyanobacteria bacterium P01_G01_bin.54]